MLSITPQASEAIRGILASESIPEGAMLRISPPPQDGDQPGGDGLAISVVQKAPPEDQLIGGDEVEVSVEPTTAELLDDKELDATVTEGQVNFMIGEKAD